MNETLPPPSAVKIHFFSARNARNYSDCKETVCL